MPRTPALALALVLSGCSGFEDLTAETRLAGRCGDGAVLYLDWVCEADGWRLVRVGEREWSCTAPHATQLTGRTAPCQVGALHGCGGVPDADCDVTQQCSTAPPAAPCGFHD